MYPFLVLPLIMCRGREKLGNSQSSQGLTCSHRTPVPTLRKPFGHWKLWRTKFSFPYRTPGGLHAREPTIGSVLQFKLFLLRLRGEVNGTLNPFGFHIKFFGNCFWKRTVCSVPVLHIGFRLEQKWEFGFWSCHLEWITPPPCFLSSVTDFQGYLYSGSFLDPVDFCWV